MLRPSNPQRFILPPTLWRLRPMQLVVIDLHDWLFPWVVINLLWVLLSLTLVLLPAATGALFATALRAYRNQPPDPRQFLRDLSHWLVPGWRWAAPNLMILGGLSLAARAVYPAEIPLAVIGVSAAVLVMLQFFFWPYMVLQDQPRVLLAWRNSAFTTLGDLFYLTLYLALAVFILIPALIVIAPFLLIVPVLLALMQTYGLAAWLEHRELLTIPGREL